MSENAHVVPANGGWNVKRAVPKSISALRQKQVLNTAVKLAAIKALN